MLRVALGYMLYQRAVIRQEVTRYMNGFRMPDFAIFYTVFLRTKNSQEPQLSPDAEISHYYIKSFVNHVVL